MTFRPRDAHGRFINRATWELAYQLSGRPVPKRVGARNQAAPLSLAQVDAATRKRAPRPARRAKAAAPKVVTPAPKIAKGVKGFPPGTEFELTARYRGAGRAARQTLHVKIRVVLTAHMDADRAHALASRAIRDGIVPPGIELAWLDWSRGSGGSAGRGRIDPVSHTTLRKMYAPIAGSGNARFAKATDYGEEEGE